MNLSYMNVKKVFNRSPIISVLWMPANRKTIFGQGQNIWYSNVEVASVKMVGRETVEYVSNIFKYYIAYSLVQNQLTKAKKSK